MTNLVFLCLIIFFKLVLLAELPVMREENTNEVVIGEEKGCQPVEIGTSEKIGERIDSVLKAMHGYSAALDEKKQRIEKLMASFNEMREQFEQEDPSKIGDLNDLVDELVKLKNTHLNELGRLNKKYSNPNIPEKGVQITGNSVIERSDE